MNTKRKVIKVRNPRAIKFEWSFFNFGFLVNEQGSVSLILNNEFSSPIAIKAKSCRKLAAWLERAADYLEYRANA